MLNYETACKLFRYDAETGYLYWAQGKPGRQFGKPAGHADKFGYRRIMFEYKMYLAHRIVWLLAHGKWPDNHIDHLDGNPRNNRLGNLRDVSRSTNLLNHKNSVQQYARKYGIV